jgi:hypothetical protein
VITGYFTASSAVIIVLQAVHRLSTACKSPQGAALPSLNYVQTHGGWVILAFQMLRLLANTILFTLAIFTAGLSDWKSQGDNVLIISTVSRF